MLLSSSQFWIFSLSACAGYVFGTALAWFHRAADWIGE